MSLVYMCTCQHTMLIKNILKEWKCLSSYVCACIWLYSTRNVTCMLWSRSLTFFLLKSTWICFRCVCFFPRIGFTMQGIQEVMLSETSSNLPLGGLHAHPHPPPLTHSLGGTVRKGAGWRMLCFYQESFRTPLIFERLLLQNKSPWDGSMGRHSWK